MAGVTLQFVRSSANGPLDGCIRTCYVAGSVMTMARLRTRAVFVPGGQPEHTYVARSARGLEAELLSASDNLCKLVTITGPTKCGKSVLAKRVYPRSSAVWIDGGAVSTEEDLWSQIVGQLGAATTTSLAREKAAAESISCNVSGGIQLPLVGVLSASASPSSTTTQRSARTETVHTTTRAAAVAALQSERKPLLIDDFHYLDKELQGTVIRALKALIFDGLPVILLAIPHRRYDAIRVEREMTGRVEQVQIPTWSRDELRTVAGLGFPLLNATVDDAVVELFVAEALGSPHLMQEFCRAVCLQAGVEETAAATVSVEPRPSAVALLSGIASELRARAKIMEPSMEILRRGWRLIRHDARSGTCS